MAWRGHARQLLFSRRPERTTVPDARSLCVLSARSASPLACSLSLSLPHPCLSSLPCCRCCSASSLSDTRASPAPRSSALRCSPLAVMDQTTQMDDDATTTTKATENTGSVEATRQAAAHTAPAPAAASATPAASLPASFFAVSPVQLSDPSTYGALFDQIAKRKSHTTENRYKPPASQRDGVLGGGSFASFLPTQPRFIPAPTFGYIPAPQQPPIDFGFGFGPGPAQPQQQTQTTQPFFSGFGAPVATTIPPAPASAAAFPPAAAPAAASGLMPAFNFSFLNAPGAAAAGTLAPAVQGAAAAATPALTPSIFAFNAAPVPAASGAASAAATPSAFSVTPAGSANSFSFPPATHAAAASADASGVAGTAAAVTAATDAVCLFCQVRLSSAAVAKDHLRSAHSFELPKVARRFHMSFEQQMQTIQWIRRFMARGDPQHNPSNPGFADAVVQTFADNYPHSLRDVDGQSSSDRTVADDLLLVWLPEDGHDAEEADDENGGDDGEAEHAQVAGIPAIQTESSFAPLSAFLAAPTAVVGTATTAASPAAFGFGFASQPPPNLADSAAASALSGLVHQPQPQSQPPSVAAAHIVPFSFGQPVSKKSKVAPPAAAAVDAAAAPHAAPLSFLGPPSASTFAFPKIAVSASAPTASVAPPAPNFSFLSSLAVAAPSAAAPIVDANALFPSSERPWMEKQSQQHASKLRPTIYSVVKKMPEPAAAASIAGQESKEALETTPATATSGLAFSFDSKPPKAATAAASSIAPFSFQPPLPIAAAASAPRTLAEIAPVDSSPENLAPNDALSHVFRFLDLRTLHTAMSVAQRWRSIVCHMRSLQFAVPSLPVLWRLLPSQRSRLPTCSFFSALDLFHPIDPKTLPLSALAKRHIGSVDSEHEASAEMLADLCLALPQLRRLTCAVHHSEDNKQLHWPRNLEYLSLRTTFLAPVTEHSLSLVYGSLADLSQLREVRFQSYVATAFSFEEQHRLNVVPAAALSALSASVCTITLVGELTADQVSVLRRCLPNLVSLTVEPVHVGEAGTVERISAQVRALVAPISDASEPGAERERPPQLQELHVAHPWNADLSLALARVPTLTTLTCLSMGAQLELDLLASLRALRTLSLSFELTATDADALVVALSHAPELTSLTLDGHGQLRPAHLSTLLSTHLALQSLSLRRLHCLDSLAFFAEANPPPVALTALDLHTVGMDADNAFTPLLSLPALRTLSILNRGFIQPQRPDLLELRARLGDAFTIQCRTLKINQPYQNTINHAALQFQAH